jgi:predicted TIM-barrel fold metal-dependent hydrolase
MAYLAAMFPNVYADFGEIQLFVAGGDLRAVVRELVGLAPASKILFSTDASLVPELYWLGARAGRRVLGEVFDEHIADHLIDERTALGMAEMILWRNAERVYRL